MPPAPRRRLICDKWPRSKPPLPEGWTACKWHVGGDIKGYDEWVFTHHQYGETKNQDALKRTHEEWLAELWARHGWGNETRRSLDRLPLLIIQDYLEQKKLAEVPPAAVAGSTSRAASSPSEASDDVEIVGSRTREERDAEGRKRAIDLDDEEGSSNKRAKIDGLETRMATARSLLDDAVDADYRERIKPAVDAYLADKIDEAELKRRKAEARETSSCASARLTILNGAYDAYLKAVEKRETWQKQLKKMLAPHEHAEDNAKQLLEAELRGIENNVARPRGESSREPPGGSSSNA